MKRHVYYDNRCSIIYLEFPLYFQMKTALEENNSYIGSHIDDCYKCVVKFSQFDPENYDEFENADNQTKKDAELFTTSHIDQNGMYHIQILANRFTNIKSNQELYSTLNLLIFEFFPQVTTLALVL